MNFNDFTDDVFAKLDKAADRAYAKAGMKAAGDVKKSMRSRGGKAGENPSAPGETPAVQTGTYRASIDWTSSPGLKGFLRIGTPDKRGPWLEKGTSRMAARPHLQPIVTRDAGEVARIFAEELKKG